ncbi:MAG: CBS domain-containing protein [Haloarculaceae archaeon]
MASTVATVNPECPARTAANRLRECDVTALVVVENGSVVGIVTAAQMRAAGVRRLPVVDDALVGLVTTDDLANYRPRHRPDVEWKGAPLDERRTTASPGD